MTISQNNYLEGHDDIIIPNVPDSPILSSSKQVDRDGIDDDRSREEMAELHVISNISTEQLTIGMKVSDDAASYLPEKHEEGIGKSPDCLHVSQFLPGLGLGDVVHLINPRAAQLLIIIAAAEEVFIILNDSYGHSAHVIANIDQVGEDSRQGNIGVLPPAS